MIGEFRGPTRWLSNFASVTIKYRGYSYLNTEAAYQAQKAMAPSEKKLFPTLSPADAKKKGMEVKLRPDWDSVKLGIMYDVNKIKFEQEPFKSQLLATSDEDLIEGNNWGDQYWGVSNGRGENNLGKIIMRIRKELQDENKGTVQTSIS